MKKILNLSAILLAIAFISCQKETTQEPSLISAAKTGSTSTSKDVYVAVTVTDRQQIKGDGKKNNVYTHNQDKVQAVIWSDGEFFMNTNTTSNKAPLRTISFHMGETGLDMNDINNVRMRIVLVEGGTKLQDITVGHSKTAGFWFWGEKPMGTFKWRLRYNRNRNWSDPATSEVTVTRTSLTTWEIEPVSPATAGLYDQNDNSLGSFDAPFKLTLRAL